MAVPCDTEDDIFFEEEQEPTRSIVIEQVWFDDEEFSAFLRTSRHSITSRNAHKRGERGEAPSSLER
jgi:hypothetical protein